MRAGKFASKVDWVNPGPHVGFSWVPKFDHNLLGLIFGRGDETVVRGGYDITYYDEGLNMFAFTAGGNPGQSQSWLLRPGIEYPAGSLTLQSTLPEYSKLPATYRAVWPQSDFTFGTTGLATMKEDLKMPWVQQWNIGVQRQIMKNTVAEMRYVGSRGHNVWHTYPINEVNVFENGFLDEFRRAQQNLTVNAANGIANSFANNGLPGQAALPIFDAAFGARGGQPALSSGQGYANANFLQWLREGQAGRLANGLATNVLYTCRMVGSTLAPCATRGYSAPGQYAMNFFVANPYAIGGNSRLVDDDSATKYHAMQLQLRRRYAGGATMSVNYTLGRNWADLWADNSTQDHNYRTLRDKSLDWQAAPFDVRHVLQAFGTYDLPFGKDRRWRIGNGILDAFLGGWTVGGILTAQSGTPFRLSSGRQTFNQFDSGVVLAPGVTIEEIQKMIRISPVANSVNHYWVDPKLIGADGRANPAYLQVPTTPGEMGQYIYLRSLPIWLLNTSLNKSTRLVGRSQLKIHITAENVFNRVTWNTPGFLGDANITSTTFGQTSNPYTQQGFGARQLYLRTEISF
jgi:hypothetical protein